jgi:hypothetical protein
MHVEDHTRKEMSKRCVTTLRMSWDDAWLGGSSRSLDEMYIQQYYAAWRCQARVELQRDGWHVQALPVVEKSSSCLGFKPVTVVNVTGTHAKVSLLTHFKFKFSKTICRLG